MKEHYIAEFERLRKSGVRTKSGLLNAFDESCYFNFKGKPKLKIKYEKLWKNYISDLTKLKAWNNSI